MGSPPPGTQQNPTGSAVSSLLIMGVMFVMLYVVLLRPQSKKQKELAAMVKNIRKGDKIITTGGVIGEVITVKEKSLSIRSVDAKFEITRSAVAEITERSGEASASAS